MNLSGWQQGDFLKILLFQRRHATQQAYDALGAIVGASKAFRPGTRDEYNMEQVATRADRLHTDYKAFWPAVRDLINFGK